MHFCAKRGIEIALCRPSVCPSVTLVDQEYHIGWKAWKLIARTISLTPSLFVAQRPSGHLLPREHIGKFGETRGGGNGVLEHKSGNIYETRKYRGKVTMVGL